MATLTESQPPLSLQNAHELYWELEKLRREMRLELAKSWKEIERLQCEKIEQNDMIECLQTRCHSLQTTLEFMASTTNTQSTNDMRRKTNRRKPSPDGKTKTLSSRKYTAPNVESTFFNEEEDDLSDYFHGYSSGDDDMCLSGEEAENMPVAEALRLVTPSSSLDLSSSFSKMFGNKSLFSQASDRSTGSTELMSSNEDLESKVEQLQREKTEQKEEYLQKLKMREESILNLEDALAVKEQTITVLRNELEERLQVSTHIQRERGRIHDTAFNAKSDIFEKNEAAKAAAKSFKDTKAESPRRVRFESGC
jgi:hypothetical protein